MVLLTIISLCFQDEENIVPSWELRVEGRLIEEVLSVYIVHGCLNLLFKSHDSSVITVHKCKL